MNNYEVKITLTVQYTTVLQADEDKYLDDEVADYVATLGYDANSVGLDYDVLQMYPTEDRYE